MHPVKVTFTFATPVVRESEHPIHFDGVLASCVAQEAEQFGSPTAWEDADDLSHLLERTEPDSGNDWVWKASQVVFEPASEKFFQSMVRRSEPEEFMAVQDAGLLAASRLRNSLLTGSGPDRSYFLFHSYQWMARATAWCIGDPLEIESALRFITSLGKMSRNGFGAVAKIEVAVSPEAESLWMNRYMPSTHVPQGGLQYAPAYRRLRAPYWKKDEMANVMMPIS